MATYLPHYPKVTLGEWHTPIDKDLHFAPSLSAKSEVAGMLFMACAERALEEMAKNLKHFTFERDGRGEQRDVGSQRRPAASKVLGMSANCMPRAVADLLPRFRHTGPGRVQWNVEQSSLCFSSRGIHEARR